MPASVQRPSTLHPKPFNLAGLVGSYHIVYNSWWRDRILKESSLSHYNMMNVLSMHALLGAYQPEGYEWTDELCEVLSGNVNFACDYIDRHFKGVNVSRPEGTYMLFCRLHRLVCRPWQNNRGCGKKPAGMSVLPSRTAGCFSVPVT